MAEHESSASIAWKRPLAVIWLGQVISNLGDSLFLVGLVFLALDVTGSKAAAGSLVALNYVPALALGLIAGALVDRYDRLRILIASDLARAATVGTLALLAARGLLGPGTLSLLVLALATGTTVFNPALKSFIPQVVPRHRLTFAGTLFQFSLYGAYVLGPLAAALLVPRIGLVSLFALDALSFVASACCLGTAALLARPLPRRAPEKPEPLFAGIAAALRTIGNHPLLRGLLIVTAAESLILMGPAYIATPLLVKERLGLGADGYASAQTAFFLGILVAAGAAGLFTRWFPRGLLMLVGLALDALTFVPLALCNTLPQVQLALFLHGTSVPFVVVSRTVLIQRTAPPEIQGRVFALTNMAVFGMSALSSILTGHAAESFAPTTILIACGLVGTIPSLLGLRLLTLRSAT